MYFPFRDREQEICLVVIEPGKFDDPIVCEMRGIARSNARYKYTAISYTWGEPDSVTSITINYQKMTVRKNCAYAMAQSRYHDFMTMSARGTRPFWIDAICINQKDDEERSAQVAAMGSTYGESEETWCCVGEADDGWPTLLRSVAHMKSADSSFFSCERDCRGSECGSERVLDRPYPLSATDLTIEPWGDSSGSFSGPTKKDQDGLVEWCDAEWAKHHAHVWLENIGSEL